MNAIDEFKHYIKVREVKEATKKLVKYIKCLCLKVYAPILEASVLNIVHPVKDPCGLALHPAIEEIENRRDKYKR